MRFGAVVPGGEISQAVFYNIISNHRLNNPHSPEKEETGMMQRRFFSTARVLQHDNPLVSISCSDKVMPMLTLLGPTSLRHPAVPPEPSRIAGEAQDSRCEEGDCGFVC